MTHFTESMIEQTVLDWLKDMGYTIVYGGDITPETMLASPRDSLLPKLMRSEVRAKEVEKDL